jgi:hypothetical protein
LLETDSNRKLVKQAMFDCQIYQHVFKVRRQHSSFASDLISKEAFDALSALSLELKSNSAGQRKVVETPARGMRLA